MSWLKRGFWLAAWSFWLWLGFGLHRELPRDLGPVVFTFENSGNAVFGATGDGQSLITFEMNNRDLPWIGRRWNVTLGRLEQQFQGPAVNESVLFEVSPTCGFLVTKRVADADRDSQWPQSLNLMTGKWTGLPADVHGDLVFHPDKPWAAIHRYAHGDRKDEVRVIDLATGKEFFRWPGSKDRVLSRAPIFTGDRLAVQTSQQHDPELTDIADVEGSILQIWSMAEPAAPPKILERVRIGYDAVSSNNGRIAWRERDVDSVRVFDVNAGRMVLSFPREPNVLLKDLLGHWPGPQISNDGRVVYAWSSGVFLDVESERALWAIRPGDIPLHWDGSEIIEIKENWSFLYDQRFSWKTYAIRDVRSGELHYRCWKPTMFSNASNAIQIAISEKASTIHRLPLVVNFPLLALCQTILALPLILLWAILRWRRNRRLRMAGVSI